MHAYHQTKLFQTLISAARSREFAADAAIQASYNQSRYVQALKALRSRNIFLYTEGTRTGTDLNTSNTIYTQPAGRRLIVLGYAENFRYGAVTTSTMAGANPAAIMLPEMHRVRIVGRNERPLVKDFVPAQAGVSGQPRFTEARLVVPTILEADEQIAIDLGYDQAAGTAAANTPPQAFIFFCLDVKDKLLPLDLEALEDVKRFIANNPFQRSVYLNCAALGLNTVGLTIASAAAAAVVCNTPPSNEPLLITGVGTTLQASKITITDTADGSSFSLNRAMQSSALMMPDYENGVVLTTFGAPVVAPIWSSYYQLPMPHLLRRGAQLRADIVNGGDAGAGANTITEQGVFNQLIFQGITV